ncbi:MAG TPA: deoxyribodipyrimidine photo-lyase [Rhizobiaceae bacterium]|nr:deoxyribodipyrimidine photo-lyase [Rhizobiaceae bacterium]
MTDTDTKSETGTPGGAAVREAPALVWFRDDLRIADNPALSAAAASGRPVIALYIHDEVSEGIRPLGGAQRWMLHHGLAALDEGLRKLGAGLVIKAGPAGDVLPKVVAQTSAGEVYWNRRHYAAGIAIDRMLKSLFAETGIIAKSFNANLLHEPSLLKTGDGGPYRVYSPFWRAFERQGEPRRPLPAPVQLNGFTATADSLRLEDLGLLPMKPDWAGGLRETWQAGEDAGLERLADFVANGLPGYADGRDFPARENFSRLSPFLRFGMISPYQAWHAAGTGSASAHDVEKFRKELGWREFSWHLLHHYPDLHWRNFNDRFDRFPWLVSSPAIDAWKEGRTGYPIVDAGMRELWRTGFMHNRVRMIAASFLIKHLMVDWRVGEEWFWDTLVDGDLANNSASWQWVAGCGADAAPYFRIFNPILQGEKFDPKGDYVRRWVPEIAGLPNSFLHKPWEATKDALVKAGITLGQTYPKPVVDHSSARDRALGAFESLKEAS